MILPLDKLTSFHNPFSAPVLFKESTESTMTDARKQVEKGCPHGTVCLTAYQSAGKGRLDGRKWLSGPGESLMFTLILEPGKLAGGSVALPLLAGLSLSKYLEKLELENIRIKWPNDVLVNGRKIAGILCKCYGDRFLLGMGVNMNQSDFPGDLRRPATSVSLEKGTEQNPAEHFQGLLAMLKNTLCSSVPVGDVSRRLYGLEQNVLIQEGHPVNGPVYTARLKGLSPDGALQVEEDTGRMKTIYSGEILEYLG